jgi:hypothetical protein
MTFGYNWLFVVSSISVAGSRFVPNLETTARATAEYFMPIGLLWGGGMV